MGTAAQLFTESMLIGLDSALQKKQFAEIDIEDIENLPYEEAVEYLAKRSVLKKADYYKLSDKLRFRAFTVGRINDGRLLEKLNSEMIKNVNDGKGLKDFLSLTKTDILNKIGMGPNQGWYWETVYRTNVQTAYNVGRAMGFEEDHPIALEFVGIDDARQTETCSSLSGTIRPYDDPFWETHTPPMHFRCRSTLRGIYDEAELPEKWSSVADAEEAAKGFGSWPTENNSWWEELASQTKAAKYYGVQQEIEAAREILIKNLEVDDFEIMAKSNDIKKEIVDEITSVVKEYENKGELYINDFKIMSIPTTVNGTPLLQIEPTSDYTIVLNINKDLFAGKTLAEINAKLAKTEVNLAKNLREAIIHECGHAKSIKGMTIKQIKQFYKELADIHITGVSPIAKTDGAEALAEIEILLARKSSVPEEAMKFYKKYMRVN